MGWMLFFMLIVLKIPLAGAGWLIWYAIKAEPELDDEPAQRRGPRPAPEAATPPATATLATPRPGRRRRGLQAAPVPAGADAGIRSRRADDRTKEIDGDGDGRRQTADGRFCSTAYRLPTKTYCSTARSSRCSPTLRLTRCNALSTVFVSQPRYSATSSYERPSR